MPRYEAPLLACGMAQVRKNAEDLRRTIIAKS